MNKASPVNWQALVTQSGAKFTKAQSPNHSPERFVADNLTFLKHSGLQTYFR
ncbi:MAG: hypothetical protein QNJ72_45565 [Pleurocapsa sp. MO_226.B13]|nr:hypothetical protein [Pleurocapsa sp. MO_226.B13]